MNAIDVEIVKQSWREGQHYTVETFGEQPTRCFVFFSSHGLYFPNDHSTFTHIILEQDRFEWRKNALRENTVNLYMRDVLKQFYLKGISSTHDSVEKIRDLILEYSQGRELTCVGSSGGGYAAMLFGSLCNADRVFSFSGFSNLHVFLKREGAMQLNPVLVDNLSNPQVEQYYSLEDRLLNASFLLFHLYPVGSELDQDQIRFFPDKPEVLRVGLRSSSHGDSCLYCNYRDLFDAPTSWLLQSKARLEASGAVPKIVLSLKISGPFVTCDYFLKRLIKKIKRSFL